MDGDVDLTQSSPPLKRAADYVFYELTQSICPDCRKVLDAQVLFKDNKVYLRRRCPDHGEFTALTYNDAGAYTANARYNRHGPSEVLDRNRPRLSF